MNELALEIETTMTTAEVAHIGKGCFGERKKVFAKQENRKWQGDILD